MFGTIIVSVNLIRAHLNTLTRPREQFKIIGILWLAPLFAVDAFLSISIRQVAHVLDFLRLCYEAYAIYLFFALMVEYLGGETRVVELLEARMMENPLQRPFPLKYCLRPPITDYHWFASCKRGVMQFVILRPLMGVISAILFFNGKYVRNNFSPNQGYLWTELIVNCSVSYAVYSLFSFYFALKIPLAPHDPIPKFVAIKAVVFLMFWQGIFLGLFAHFKALRGVGVSSNAKIYKNLRNE